MVGIDSVLQGRFRLDRQIGRGGFARVFLASDLTLHRQVAIKVLNPELLEETDEHDFRARFRQEARAVAALEHPNILGVYDYGEAEGVIYLVMPYIEGGTLFTRLAAGRPLGLEETASYLRQAAAALDFAHRRNFVHRDIKPQNMLLRAEDNRLLLADFGIAKVLTSTSRQSQTGVVGTLAYMAPEQFQGRASAAIDIYALGCVLFQMLTGQVPFDGSTEQIIFGHLSSTVPSVTERSRGRVPAEIQPIIERALEKRPEDRYGSAGELSAAFDAALGVTSPLSPSSLPRPIAPTQAMPPRAVQIPPDLPTFRRDSAGENSPAPPTIEMTRLDSGPVSGSVLPSSASDGARSFSQPPIVATPPPPIAPSHPATPSAVPAQIPYPVAPPPQRSSSRAFVLSLVAAVLFLAVIGVGVALRSLRPGGNQATATVGGGSTAGQATATAPVVASVVALPPTAAPSSAPSTGPSAPPTVTTAPPASSKPIVAPSAAPSAVPSVAPGAPPRPPIAGTTAVTFSGHTDDVRGLAWTADGKQLISGGSDGSVRYWQPDGKLLNTITGRTFAVTSVALSPDGSKLAVGSDDRKVHLWAADGTPIAILTDHTDIVVSVAWSPDGKMLASASNDKTVRLWTADGKPIRTLAGHGDVVQSVAWSPDGQMLATASWDKTVRLWRLDGSLFATLSGHTDQVFAVAWSPDGKTVASGSRDGTVRLWTAAGQPIRTLTGHTSFVSSLAWSPDGKTLASGSFDKTVRLWAADGTPLATFTGHTDAVTCLAWLPDGTGLASGSWDNTIRLWR